MYNKRLKNHAVIKGFNKGVTGSAISCSFERNYSDNYNSLIDDGFYQGGEFEELTYNKLNSQKYDGVFITHNHLDHTGALPILVKEGYKNPIYTTSATRELLDIAYKDNLSIFAERCKSSKKGKKNKKAKMPYNSGDVKKTLNQIKPFDFEKTIQLDENLTATFFENQHLVGSSLILFRSNPYNCDELNILFTGDYNNKNSFMDSVDLPEWVYSLKNLTLVTEATYGKTNSDDIKYVWRDNMIKSIQQNKSILLLGFAQGRIQELLYRIKLLQDEGLIPDDYIIILDGKSAKKYTTLYEKDEILNIKPSMRNFKPKKLLFADNKNRMSLLHSKSKKIIISTSGMGNFGPAKTYIPEFLSDPNCVIHFNGYTAKDTLGRKLLELEKGELISINDVLIPKRAEVYCTSEFSSHAQADTLIKFIKKFNNLRSVLITHGEEDTKYLFAKLVINETLIKKVAILGEDKSFRIGPYGIIKSS